MWSQRDQFTNAQLPIVDQQLISDQHTTRTKNHSASSTSKAPFGVHRDELDINPGDIVYLYSDKSKLHGRDRYLVTSVDKPWCNIRKFAGTQFRCNSYRVKINECFKVPNETNPNLQYNQHMPLTNTEEDDTDDIIDPPSPTPVKIVHQPPTPQLIPVEISDPITNVEPVTAIQPANNEEVTTPVDTENITVVVPAPRRLTRTKNIPVYLNDYDL